MSYTLLHSHRGSSALKSAGFVLLCAALMVSGCAKQNGTTSRNPLGNGDASFAAGAGRAPTAATSYSFAKILASQGRDHDALYVLSRIVRDHPTFLPAYNDIASLYVRADRLDDAIDVLEIALKHAPQDAVLLNNLGMCCLLSEENDRALEYFTQAADVAPTNPTYRANRATALALLGRQKEAEADYRNVLGTNATRENLKILAKARAQNPAAAESSDTPAIQAKSPTTAPAPGAVSTKDDVEPVILARTESERPAAKVSAPAQKKPAESAKPKRGWFQKKTPATKPASQAKSGGWFKKKEPATQPAPKAKSGGWFKKKEPVAASSATTQPAPKAKRSFFGLFSKKQG